MSIHDGRNGWEHTNAAQRDPVSELLQQLTLGDWARIWWTRPPRNIPPVLAKQVQLMVTELSLRSMTASSLLGVPAWLCLMIFVLPETGAARVWSISPVFVFLYAAWVLPRLFRLKRQGGLTMANYQLAVAPTVVYSAFVWGTLPFAVGVENLGRFYLTFCVVTVVSISGITWLMGFWPLAMVYSIIQAVASSAAFFYFDRPEASAIAVMMAMLVLAIFGITVVTMFLLTRSLLQTVTARDRQGMIEMLMRDYERGGHDWIWEVDEDLVLQHVPPRMAVASCGDHRIRPGVDLLTVVAGDPVALAAIEGSKPFQVVIHTSGDDGTGEIRLWGRPNVISGRRVGYRGVGSDQGAARRAADAELTAERLDAMVALTGGINHDYNNQMATVMGSVELARMSLADPAKTVGYLDRAIAACMRSRAITADLSAALGLHAPSQAVPFDVAAEVGTVVADVATVFPNMTLDLRIEGTVNGVADPTYFVRAVRNLVQNACQANERNPATTGMVWIEVTAVASEAGPMACVKVGDDGPGIDPTVAHRIFEPFFTTRRYAGGTGLGLSVAHGFARQAGGSLRLEPGPAATTFVLEIPLAMGVEPLHPSSTECPATVVATDLLQGTFLVVEDDEQVAMTLIGWVEALGGEADWVSTIEKGIERVKDPENQYRCVVCDIVLPDGEGFSVIAALRERIPDAPAIYLSGFSRTLPNTVEKALRCPFVPKPFSSAELIQAFGEAGVIEAEATVVRADSRSLPASVVRD